MPRNIAKPGGRTYDPRREDVDEPPLSWPESDIRLEDRPGVPIDPDPYGVRAMPGWLQELIPAFNYPRGYWDQQSALDKRALPKEAASPDEAMEEMLYRDALLKALSPRGRR